jgi:hypothetical protein
MSVDPKQQLNKTKIIGFRVTEEELQNTIYPIMHDCYQLGIIDHDIPWRRSCAFASNSGLGTTAWRSSSLNEPVRGRAGGGEACRHSHWEGAGLQEQLSSTSDREGTTGDLERLEKELNKGFFDDEATTQQHSHHHPQNQGQGHGQQKQQQQQQKNPWVLMMSLTKNTWGWKWKK